MVSFTVIVKREEVFVRIPDRLCVELSKASFRTKRNMWAIAIEALEKYGHRTDKMIQQAIARHVVHIIKATEGRRGFKLV